MHIYKNSGVIWTEKLYMWHSKKFHMWFVHICTYTVFHILYVHILYLHMGLLVISKRHILIPKWLKRSIANEAQNVIYDTCVPTISKRMCCHDSVSSCCVLILTLDPCVSPLFQFRPCVFSWVSWFSYFQPVRIKLALDSPPALWEIIQADKRKMKSPGIRPVQLIWTASREDYSS